MQLKSKIKLKRMNKSSFFFKIAIIESGFGFSVMVPVPAHFNSLYRSLNPLKN